MPIPYAHTDETFTEEGVPIPKPEPVAEIADAAQDADTKAEGAPEAKKRGRPAKK